VKRADVKDTTVMTKKYGIYSVTEDWQADGKWGGYTVRCVDNTGKRQGKLYVKTDGRENYQAAPPPEKPEPGNSEDLEI